MSEELFNVVDSDSLVNRASCTRLLAALVTDMTANSGERVFLFDKRERLVVSSLRRHFEITLNSDMRGARRLTRSGTRFVGVDSVFISVFGLPLFTAPFNRIGKLLTRVFNLAAVLLTELLSELERACGAVLNTAAARNAVLLLYVCNVSRARHIRRVEKLRGTKRVANVYVTVTDSENLILAVDVCNLVNEAVLLALPEDFERLLSRYIVAALFRFNNVVSHISDSDAPALGVVGAALVVGLSRITARARGSRVFAVVFIKPVGDFFKSYCLVFHFDSLFNGDNVHSYSAAAGRHHRRNLFKRVTRHSLEEASELGMLLKKLVVHI